MRLNKDKKMVKKFNIKNISPFDLMRWGKDEFYNVASQEYYNQFGKWIEILEAHTSFIKDGVRVEIIAYRG